MLVCIPFTFPEAEIGFHQFSQKQPIIQKMYAIHKNMRFVQMKLVQGLCWAQEQRLLRIVPWVLGQSSHGHTSQWITPAKKSMGCWYNY
jgi:hypothetical protein